ncbi:hypothetical protein C5167_025076, partial [Papaver somniferum]
MDKGDSSQLPEFLSLGLQMISEEEPLANSNISGDAMSNSNTDDMMPNSCTMEPLANSDTKELVVACPIRSFEKMSHPEEEQTDAGDELTSTGSFATEKNSASLRDEDTLFEHKAEPVHVPRSVALTITAKEGLPSVFKSSNNVKRTAAERKSNSQEKAVFITRSECMCSKMEDAQRLKSRIRNAANCALLLVRQLHSIFPIIGFSQLSSSTMLNSVGIVTTNFGNKSMSYVVLLQEDICGRDIVVTRIAAYAVWSSRVQNALTITNHIW